MTTISEIVQSLVKASPFVSEALHQGLINVSALARKFQPEIEKQLKRKVKKGAIVMAINRLNFGALTYETRRLINFFHTLGDMSVRSSLVAYTFSNSDTLLQNQVKLLEIIGKYPKIFYTFSQGIAETTIIVTNTIANEMEAIFKTEKQLDKQADLASITLMLPDENRSLYGVYYYILKDIAWNGINLVEVISTSNEFTLIVKHQDIDKAFSILMQLKIKK